MDLYARVNILDGRAVRLPRGDVHDAIALHNDPLGRINNWFQQGADHVHVVDLDAAAFGDDKNRYLIDRILDEATGRVQVAGGIRSHVEAARLLEQGAWRIVMGTAAIEDQNMVWDLCREFPGRVAVSLDVRSDEEIATRGWTKNSGRYLEEVLIEMSSAGAAAFMVSEIGRDILTEPTNVQILAEALATVEEPIVAAGGVRDLEDLGRLLSLSIHGRTLAGVVVGREVTQGRFSLAEAKEAIAQGPVRTTSEAPAPEPVARASSVPPLLADAAAAYLRAAEAAENAAADARAAASLMQSGEGEKGAAAAFAANGHLALALEQIEKLAKAHAQRSTS
ncbi:MAG TPA: HisA/HisF-related TIM barrel protein [Acidimicrobiia bacterium]|nr:HisA/HisF-related TIM barrel protein [Acidimicrobiia bacterium]